MTFSKSILAFISIIVASVFSGTALAENELSWKIENRFRLFRDTEKFRIMELVWDDLKRANKANAFEFERVMQEHAAAKTPGKHFSSGYDPERYGWTAALLGPAESCFDPAAGGHFRCRLQNGELLVEPKTTEIVVSPGETLSASLRGKGCRWRIGAQTREARCDRDLRIVGIPFDSPFEIAVEHQGAVIARLERQTAKHIIIAGFGDSFASGEGNPDKPVDLQDFHVRNYEDEGWYPLRPGATDRAFGRAGTSARFLHQQCHRSLYSSQLRAALTVALQEAHVAITFLGYACSGAKTPDLFRTFYNGWKDVPNTTYDDAPQITKFHRDFCRSDFGYRRVPTRRSGEVNITACPEAERRAHPHAILLSTGGNDVGFGRVVAHETVTATEQFSDILYEFLPKLSPYEARQAAPPILRNNIRAFSNALARHVSTPPRAIIQTGYPYVTTLAANQFCDAGDLGMDIHHKLEITNPDTGQTVASLVDFINTTIENSIESLPDDRQWTFIRPSLNEFKGHPLCRSGAPTGARDFRISGEMNSPDIVGENRGQRVWAPFQPSQWRSYRERNRWFHTPNDAFMTVNYMRFGGGFGEPQKIDDKFLPLLAATTGAFHPNNWGHAKIADGIVPTLREALGLSRIP